ncbi:MAG: hypothetical protein LKK07_10075 [Lactococcus lactis]|jgi:hypothetical protein|nr:hypothetical protein [Lactococcus lactis]MCI2139603.1 hypothetical protein [Lactococcus lactis]MCI2189590.1 hypothetical protein [Lactococcus lactis]
MSKNGFDDLSKKLNNMAKKAKELDGKREVKLVELFNSNFMSSNTKFSSFEDFADASKFDWSDVEGIPEDELDIFINQNSSFNSWEEMYKDAATDYYAKQLGF